MAFPLKLCEKLSDLVCKNCIFWIGGECRTSKPPWPSTEADAWCGDGYWYCRVWKCREELTPSKGGYRTQELLPLINYVESVIYEEDHRKYVEGEEAHHKAYAKEWEPKNNKARYEQLDFITKQLSDDIYAVKEKLGLN